MRKIGKYAIMKEEEVNDIAKAFNTIYSDILTISRLAIERQCLITGVTPQDRETISYKGELMDTAYDWVKRFTLIND